MCAAALKVLVVDGEQLLLWALERAGRGSFLEIKTAVTARQALKEIEGCHYDLFMLDFDLNDQNSLELLKSIDDRCPYTPVIIMTTGEEKSADLTDAVRTFRKQGAWHLLEKPFSLERMMHLVELIFQDYGNVQLGQKSLTHNFDQEKRGKFRRPYVQPVKFSYKTIRDGGIERISAAGILTDISDFGSGVLAHEQLQTDQVISFEDDFMKISGVVAWSVMIDPETCRFGVQFC